MRDIKVEFYTTAPDNVTDEQIQEWLEFELHTKGDMKNSNPLVWTDIEAKYVEFR